MKAQKTPNLLDPERSKIYSDNTLTPQSQVALDSNYLRNQNRIKEEMKTKTSEETFFEKMKSFLASYDDKKFNSFLEKMKNLNIKDNVECTKENDDEIIEKLKSHTQLSEALKHRMQPASVTLKALQGEQRKIKSMTGGGQTPLEPKANMMKSIKLLSDIVEQTGSGMPQQRRQRRRREWLHMPF